MTTATLKGLLPRKLRTGLTALAIVLGVAMVSGSYVLTDSISHAFDTIFASSYSHTDAVISGKSLTDYSNAGRAPVSAALLARVRATPGVAAAAGEIVDLNSNADQAKLLDKHGKVVTGKGSPTFGLGVDPSQPRFNPLKLTAGRWATGPGEVVLDAGSASKHGFRVGDPIRIEVGGPVRPFRVVGIAKYGNVNTIGSATFAVFDVGVAKALLHKTGFDAISVAAARGVSQDELVQRLRKIVPANAQVKTGADQAKEDKQGVAGFVSFIRYALLGFGGVALFVGAFVIFNTLSITVAQRTREFATLRTLGASRRQVRRAVVLEAVVVGLLASLIGLGAGFGLAKGLVALLSAAGLDLPRSGVALAPRTIAVSLVLGVVITVVAGLHPAIRATRIPPIAAVREGATLPRGRRSNALALALLVAGAGLLGLGLFVHGPAVWIHIAAAGTGVVALFVGIAAGASQLVAPLARLLGRAVGARAGAAGRLARENASRNPGRTAATAAALMVGLALVTCLSAFSKGLLRSHTVDVTRQLRADAVVVSQSGWSPLPLSVGRAVARTPGVSVASSVRAERARFGSSNIDVSGIDPRTIGAVYDIRVGRLAPGEAIVGAPWAKKHHLAVDDAFTIRTPAARTVALRVAATYTPAKLDELLGNVLISQRTFDASFETPGDEFTFIRTDDPGAVAATLQAYPDARVLTTSKFVDDRAAGLKSILNLVYVLLALSVVVSLFGMVNTLVLSVFERTREIGMLRAVGMTRRQARRMIRRESLLTALIGAALGIPVGLGLALALTRALASHGVTFALPLGSIVAFTAVAIVAGTVAAIIPARRAGKLNVLAALQYE